MAESATRELLRSLGLGGAWEGTQTACTMRQWRSR
jgi:hypothetical protein